MGKNTEPTFVKPMTGEAPRYTAFELASSGAGAGEPPLLTGGQLLPDSDSESGCVPRIDWLQLTFADDHEGVQQLASTALGRELGDWTASEKGGPGYACGLIGPGKSMLWYAPGGDRTDVHLILPGTACGMMGWDRMRDFLVAAVRLKAKPTRLDVAIDDFDRRIGVFGVLELLDGDKAVSMARDWTMIVSGKIGSGSLKLAASSEDFMKGWQEMVESATVYVGAPSSRQRMRVYDKYRESKGKINSTRWELQMRDDAAQQMLLDLVAAGDEWGRAVREHFVSFIDFRDQRTKNVTRGVRMEFYRQMMHEAKRVKMYPPKAARTMEELVEWKFKTQAPTLAVMDRVYGRGMVDAMIEHGRTRLKPHHRALMASTLAM